MKQAGILQCTGLCACFFKWIFTGVCYRVNKEKKMKGLKILLLVISLTLSSLAFAAGEININTADKEMLMTGISGIGEKRAEAIVSYREANGPFNSVEELLNVRGVGKATLDKNRENLTVSK